MGMGMKMHMQRKQQQHIQMYGKCNKLIKNCADIALLSAL